MKTEIINIRQANYPDLERIMEIYRAAQDYMISYGNGSQWGRSYPTRDDVLNDIERGFCHVLYDGTGMHAVFALCEGEDPYYNRIDGGTWLNEEPYVSIHRVASDGEFRGVVTFAADFCKIRYDSVRVDTHEKNAPMRRQLEKNGFVRCGTVYVRDSSPRIAYQWTREMQ